eukprot:2039994-Rhodomonas_salina.1
MKRERVKRKKEKGLRRALSSPAGLSSYPLPTYLGPQAYLPGTYLPWSKRLEAAVTPFCRSPLCPRSSLDP